MTLGNGNKQLRSLFHRKEREFVKSYKNLYDTQLKTIKKYDRRFGGGFGLNYKWIEVNAKLELCKKLLGEEND